MLSQELLAETGLDVFEDAVRKFPRLGREAFAPAFERIGATRSMLWMALSMAGAPDDLLLARQEELENPQLYRNVRQGVISTLLVTPEGANDPEVYLSTSATAFAKSHAFARAVREWLSGALSDEEEEPNILPFPTLRAG